jgi:subtilase family serine protease
MHLGFIRIAALSTVSLFVTACSSSSQVTPPSVASMPLLNAHVVCGPVAPGFARCLVLQSNTGGGNTGTNGGPGAAVTTISGYHPADLQAAYSLPSLTAGAGKMVAIVDAFDDPNAESDLAVYRSTFGLPACSTANGCFEKINQSGVEGSYPTANTDWSEEISLDVDMVSATCPNCRILLVEANSNAWADFFASVNMAAAFSPVAISNSYGAAEYSGEVTDAANYHHPGIAVTASSGDNGYLAEFPAASSYVTAVGGTSLLVAGNARGWSETAWSGSGSGCSAYITKPVWQKDLGCANRTIADVAVVGDPNTGVASYDTYGLAGWQVFGGSSIGAPVVASAYALAGNTAGLTYGSYPYAHASSLFDIVSGSNGTCSSPYLCNAGVGYDGPTGLGTPNGIGAF